MKNISVQHLVVWVLVLQVCAFGSGSIQDPIADYLSMNVNDRKEFVGTPELISRVKIDLDNDGKNEVFIGAWYRYSGSKNAFYWAGYKESQGGGFERITPADSDVFLEFDGIFAGQIQELSIEGLVQTYGREVDNESDANITKIENLMFYYISDGRLVEDPQGELNLTNASDYAAYQRYFGDDRNSRAISSKETLNAQELRKLGYIIPNWDPPAP